MTEAHEIADNTTPPRFKDITHCYNWVRQLMPSESISVREDVAIILWNRQIRAAMRARVVAAEAQADRRIG